jgi:hypothetical protein
LPGYQAAKITRTLAVTEPSVNLFPVLTLREPIFHGVDFIGCASANMTMDVLSRFLDKHRTCARSTTLVADRNNGKIIAFEATTKGVRAARAERLNCLRCPAFLLSGLLICGCCGGKYGVNDRYGCVGHFRKGMCDNGRTIRRDDIERRVLAASPTSRYLSRLWRSRCAPTPWKPTARTMNGERSWKLIVAPSRR